MTDRHARHRRSLSDRRRRPVDGFRAASTDRFERLVADAVSSLPPRFAAHLTGVQVGVEDVPPDGPRDAGSEVPLARYDGEGTPPDRLVVYRRPLEARAVSQRDLVELVRQTVAVQIARQAGLDDDLEGFGWG